VIRDHPPEPAYEIPERSGEVLIAPPLDRIGDILAENRALSWGEAEILGTPLAEFRARTRSRVLSLAARYSTAAPPLPAHPLILMGHQPVFFHPGVWMKYFLLTRLRVTLGATGVHLIVDSDATGPITAVVPAYRGDLVRVSETLVDLPEDVPLEAFRPPTAKEWTEFVGRVAGHVRSVPGERFAARVDALAAGGGRALSGSRTLGDFLAAVRRAYEAQAGAPGYLEVPVSHVAETPEFYAFVLHVVRRAEDFQRSYNAHLEEYRRLHRLRSVANPFPNLAQGDAGIEMPFWVLRGGRRTDLFVARRGSRLALATAGGPLATVTPDLSGVEALRDAPLALRPKAILLTMFARLCLGDLFIHGVGGARYDQVTDAIIADVFGCRPPAYAVATATLHLSLPHEAAPAEERRMLERRLMDLQHNPDRHLETVSEAERLLVGEKWGLIREIETMRPGPERRAATRRIREINGRLREALAPEIARIEARLAALDRQTAAGDAAHFREYPYFLFDPGEVGALVGAPACPA
jgi:hypothetical protein